MGHQMEQNRLLLAWSGVFLFLFGLTALGVNSGALSRVDQAAGALAAALHSPLLTEWMKGVTMLGGGYFLAPAGVLLALLALRRRRYAEGLAIVLILAGGDGLNEAAKTLFARPRPEGWGLLESPASWSFPSGHAMVGGAFYALLCFFTVRQAPLARWRGVVCAAAAFLILNVSLSRVYLGVHYATDVIAGWWLGAAWLLLVVYLYEKAVIWLHPQSPSIPSAYRE